MAPNIPAVPITAKRKKEFSRYFENRIPQTKENAENKINLIKLGIETVAKTKIITNCTIM